MSELEAGIVGRDPDALTRFYVDAFGFEVTERLEFDAIGVVLKLRRDLARCKLFFPADAATDPGGVDPWFAWSGWRYAALYLGSLEELHSLVDAVPAHGGTVVLAPTNHRPGAATAVVTDPEGNHWELLWEARRR